MDNNHNRQAERHVARLATVLAQRERVQRQLILGRRRRSVTRLCFRAGRGRHASLGARRE
ncbi:hypothetical protein BCR44DRAFT_36234 [Catenaria anguillulae PL171]|uniref:Uncharacterized protein n=1 Tax=Catenaria anguillulae PL171 TaxID=765915 RepID=A0A1Y2H7R2_9FUNG|nr:hypothetical protein BCR44DRAFT_36234 [Catenaria anguillulae PL171]